MKKLPGITCISLHPLYPEGVALPQEVEQGKDPAVRTSYFLRRLWGERKSSNHNRLLTSIIVRLLCCPKSSHRRNYCHPS